MTLDDEQIPWREMARRDQEYYDSVLRQEWLDREACESVEARETYWRGVFAQDPYPDTHYDEPSSLDRRARFPHD
jgi:hypothetical protein